MLNPKNAINRLIKQYALDVEYQKMHPRETPEDIRKVSRCRHEGR